MEDISPSWKCINYIQFALLEGKSLQEALLDYVAINKDSLAKSLEIWLAMHLSGREENLNQLQFSSELQIGLVEVFRRGLLGYPVHSALKSLSLEVRRASHGEAQEYLAKLPFKAMLPLFMFQMPAFLLVILGPLFNELLKGVNHV